MKAARKAACHAFGLHAFGLHALGLTFALAFALVQIPAIADAADFSDPDWPCIQRKVENLSPGLMWPLPVGRAPLAVAASDLVAVLSLRRVTLEEAEAHLRAFAGKSAKLDGNLLGNIFYGVFDELVQRRQRLIAGIARYSRKQIALSSRIDQTRVEMARLAAEKPPDFDRIDKLEEQIGWDERIYQGRTQALTYVCETPALLEKRAYAIGQILRKYMPQ